MLLASSVIPRKFPRLAPAQERLFEVAPSARILGHCHWQPEPKAAPTIVLVHGLEGSADSNYMRGIAELAFAAGFNAIRLNQRNCGGTEKLTPTLYNSGLSADFRAVLEELIGRDGLREVFFAGYSMGGNLVLKMAGELGAAAPPELCGVCGVGASLDLEQCVAATELPRNAFYEWYFVAKLKRRMRRKIELFPEIYSANGLNRVRSLREFDDQFTAPHSGYKGAADYYFRASALRVVAEIRVPTLILYAEDDPLVPPSTFAHPEVTQNPNIELRPAKHGSHCVFLSNDPAERHWAEARIVEFCLGKTQLVSRR
jgi:uncharacterized protein